MNKALTKHFLQLMLTAHRQGYKNILVGEPNRRFEVTLVGEPT